MMKQGEIIEFPNYKIKIGNYVKESKIVKISKESHVLKTIRRNRGLIQELIFARIYSGKEEMNYLFFTAILPIIEGNENYLNYKNILDKDSK